jgi:hypothetical protein
VRESICTWMVIEVSFDSDRWINAEGYPGRETRGCRRASGCRRHKCPRPRDRQLSNQVGCSGLGRRLSGIDSPRSCSLEIKDSGLWPSAGPWNDTELSQVLQLCPATSLDAAAESMGFPVRVVASLLDVGICAHIPAIDSASCVLPRR